MIQVVVRQTCLKQIMRTCIKIKKKDDWDLKDEAARYHEGNEKRDHFHDQDPPKIHSLASASPPCNKKRRALPPDVGFMGAMQEARTGDMSFCFPVTAFDDEQPQWEPLPLKTLKELQMAVKSMEPSSPYTLQILNIIKSMWLTPYY